jgi:hypothetical protein
MKVKEFRTKFNDIYIYPLGDIHIGDKGFTKESERKLKGYVDFIKTTPNAFAILQGDLLNCATRVSKSSPFEQNMDLKDQIEMAVDILKPIKNKILGAIDGNHEQRLSDFAGYSPTISICERLGIDYMKDSALYIIRMACHSQKGIPRTSFTLYSHHTTGGNGRTVGSKINRVEVMREIVANADVYCGSHNHQLAAVPAVTQMINQTEGKIEIVRQMLVDCGGYLEWDSTYAERMMLPPLKLGSPRVHLIVKRETKDGIEETHKDCHVSL